jgi:hypothetical protein
MRTLRAVIEALQAHGKFLPEPLCDCYDAHAPSGARWPTGLPSSPLLRDFYAACDGARLGAFRFLPLGELTSRTADVVDWMKSTGCDAMPTEGQWLAFGRHECGLDLIWDADRDAVLLYGSDGGDIWDADDTSLAYDGSARPTGHLTLARFFERLVNPASGSDDESTRTWDEVLQYLDQYDSSSEG